MLYWCLLIISSMISCEGLYGLPGSSFSSTWKVCSFPPALRNVIWTGVSWSEVAGNCCSVGSVIFYRDPQLLKLGKEPLFRTGLMRDFQAVPQAKRVILMRKYHHLCLTAAHQPLLLITCLPVTFLLKSAFGPTVKSILYVFCENLSESLLSHLNLSLKFSKAAGPCLMSCVCCNLTDWTGLQYWDFLLQHTWVPHSQLQSTVWTHCQQPLHLLFMISFSVLCPLMILSYLFRQ